MKKITTLVMMALLAIAGIVRAGGPVFQSIGDVNARVAGLGNASLFVADRADIWSLPAVLANHPNAMYMEFGQSLIDANTTTTVSALPNQPWGGAHLALGGGVLGIYLNRPVNELSTVYTAAGHLFTDSWSSGITPGNGDYSNVDSILGITNNVFNFSNDGEFDIVNLSTFGAPKDRVDLMYAWNLNDKTTVGVGLNRANAGGVYKTTSYEIGYDASNYGLSLGADMKDLGAINLLEIGLMDNIENIGVTRKYGVEDKFGSSGNAFNARVGADISSYRVEAKVGSQMLSIKDTPNGGSVTEEKVSALSWGLGVAMSKHSAKMFGLAGLILGGGGNQVEFGGGTTKAGNFSLGYATAGEGKILEWLTARAGVSGNILSNNTTDNGAGTTTSSSAPAGAKLSTGLGLSFGDLVIDGSLNQNILYTGGFLTSGITNSLFGQVSATWSFGGAKE